MRINKVEALTQKRALWVGRIFLDWVFFLAAIGMIITNTEAARATTPPTFDGIDRSTAYANRKYHSGWMCVGVASGFASAKFSGSEALNGM